jgi:hypothetical protein
MDVEKNVTSNVGSEKNEPINFGRSETYKITILRLKLCYFGHVMSAKGSLKRDIMLGQVAGYRRQGKPRMRRLESIKEATGLRLEASKETVQGKKKWPMLVEGKPWNSERTNVK